MEFVQCDDCGCTPSTLTHGGEIVLSCACEQVLIVGRERHLLDKWS